MKHLALSIITLLTVFCSAAQSKLVKEINQLTPAAQALYPLRFLASDELMGRGTMRPEIQVAARYISEEFRSMGLKEVDGAKDYLQKFDIQLFQPGATGTLTVNNSSFSIGKDLLQMRGTNVSHNSPLVYIGYGDKADWEKVDVKGKIVMVDIRRDSSGLVRNEINGMDTRHQLASDHGAAALIVRFAEGDVQWPAVQTFFQRSRLWNATPLTTPVFLIRENENNIGHLLKGDVSASLDVNSNKLQKLPASNVMGYVEGTEPDLKDEFIVLSAHYDHLGVAEKSKIEEGKLDSIYNGARDNAIGVAAVMNAARYFAKRPAKRSILFIAFTAEEMGMGGSKYFAENPTVPLKQMVYNLNIDNGGYNDTTFITIIGLRRTSADDDIKKACTAYGLKVIADPAPQQNLFDRSDNVSFAAKGIPAPTFSLGFTSFDATLMKRYHQLSDEIGDLDMKYMVKFIRCYVLAAKYIADNPDQPEWKAGDKYEAAWKMLYGK